MISRMRNSDGFTLAELLLSVAIILVLAAIAIPSIVNAQNNMRMVELDNAAQSIANAAQTQMTSMKVSGTWLAFAETTDDEGKKASAYPKAINPPSGVSADDTYYITASDTDIDKVVPGLSIDDTVRNGDYVIEFSLSTASVVSVFYTDGKSGFFGSAPEGGTEAAQDYYKKSGSRNLDTRRGEDPMIGYYEGTPSGATDAVALENPVIWVDEDTGRLMVQDPNIAEDGSKGDTVSTITVKNKTKEIQFVLSSLDNGTSLMYVGLEDNDGADGGMTGEFLLSGNELKDVMSQVDRTGAEGGNVFAIDLNALARKVTQTGSKASSDLQAAFTACQPDDDLEVNVTTKATNRNCVPSKAMARIKWPAPVGKLTLMVTNPYSSVVAASEGEDRKYVDPSLYIAPTVRAATDEHKGTENGVESTPESEDTVNYLRDTSANREIAKENKQSAYQSYSGGWVSSSDVDTDETFRFEANVGSYSGHSYQIWELWIKRSDNGEATRVGYLENNQWVWASFTQDGINYDYSFLNECLTWYDKDGVAYRGVNDSGLGINTDELGIVTIAVDSKRLYELASSHLTYGIADEDGNASIYIRTAPKSSEVQAYFNHLAEDKNALKSTYLSQTDVESSSRNFSDSSGSSQARKAFEGEFGASSSDVSWVVSCDTDAGFDQGTSYLKTEKNVRVYYSISPGVGFENIRDYGNADNDLYLTDVRSTGMTNVSLWLYRGSSYEGLRASSPSIQWKYDATRYTCVKSGSGLYDFKLSTKQDYLFYRVLTYDGVNSGTVDSQYAPHVQANDVVLAKAESYEDDDYVYIFSHWETNDSVDGSLINCFGGEKLGDCESLSFKGTTFKANYVAQNKIGLMYLEFGSNSEVGYSGYSVVNQEIQPALLTNETDIVSWGYYAVVRHGALEKGQQLKIQSTGVTVSQKYTTVNLGGKEYDAYLLTNTDRTKTQSVELFATGKGEDVKSQYWFNSNFACAIANNESDSKTMGTESNPWIVRHATQFPGAVQPNGGAQSVYVKDYFKQTHTIDMSEARADKYEKKFTNTFAGTYDGGSDEGCLIKNFRYRLFSEQNHRMGLFPYAKDATLKNIHLFDDSGDVQTDKWDGENVNALFGCLAGETLNCSISNCSIDVQNPKDKQLIIQVANVGTSNSSAVGCLVGLATNTTLEKCTVSGLTMTLECRESEWDKNRDVSLGGLVGQSANSSIVACSVLDTSITSLTPTASARHLMAGGVTGYISAGGNNKGNIIDSCSVSNVTFKADRQTLVAIGGVVGLGSEDGVNSNNEFTKVLIYSALYPDGLEVKSMIGTKDPS